MSYDLLCYPSKSGTVDKSEAQDFDSIEGSNADAPLRSNKQKVVSALVHSNPRLEPFLFDYPQIAKLDRISEEEARRKYSHVELNAPEGDPAIQLTIYDDRVDITIPYWYGAGESASVFAQLFAYLRIIRETAGYFVYDPQTDSAFDPLLIESLDHETYDRVMLKIPDIVSGSRKTKTRAWWKFWER